MRKITVALCIAALAIAVGVWVYGGQVLGYVRFQRHSADEAAEAARTPIYVVAQGCFGCHGDRGASLAGRYPYLAGQAPSYLALQLEAMASGHRQAPIMAPLARAMGPAQRDALAKWFAAQPARALANGALPAALQPCAACHGPGLAGQPGPIAAPRIAGLGADYVAAQLRGFREGRRDSDAMTAIARGLDERQIDSLSRLVAKR